MSEFDEEAEREKLREQFAEDEKRREKSSRMGDLLLQGATMTNSHCDRCGDPLFRYEDRTFCPSCQYEDGDPADERTEDSAASAGATTDADDTETETRNGDRTATTRNAERIEIDDAPKGETGEAESEAHASASESATERPADRSPAARRRPENEPAGSPNRDDVRTDSPAVAGATADSVAADPATAEGDVASGADLDSVEASLVRTLSRSATAAEGSDSGTREHLAAAREAAEALAALRRARR